MTDFPVSRHCTPMGDLIRLDDERYHPRGPLVFLPELDWPVVPLLNALQARQLETVASCDRGQLMFLGADTRTLAAADAVLKAMGRGTVSVWFSQTSLGEDWRCPVWFTPELRDGEHVGDEDWRVATDRITTMRLPRKEREGVEQHLFRAIRDQAATIPAELPRDSSGSTDTRRLHTKSSTLANVSRITLCRHRGDLLCGNESLDGAPFHLRVAGGPPNDDGLIIWSCAGENFAEVEAIAEDVFGLNLTLDAERIAL